MIVDENHIKINELNGDINNLQIEKENNRK